MMGLIYNRIQEMKEPKPNINKSPYARIRQWKLFRKRMLNSKKEYDRRNQNLTLRRRNGNVHRTSYNKVHII